MFCEKFRGAFLPIPLLASGDYYDLSVIFDIFILFFLI